jgi:hypothetical protein
LLPKLYNKLINNSEFISVFLLNYDYELYTILDNNKQKEQSFNYTSALFKADFNKKIKANKTLD